MELSPNLNPYYDNNFRQHWAEWDEVGVDQCPATHSHALLLRRKVGSTYLQLKFNWILSYLLSPAGSAIAWSWRGPRRRTSWATCSSTWSTSPASSSLRRRCARRGTGGAGARWRRRSQWQSGRNRCLIGTAVFDAQCEAKVCDRVQILESG